MWIIIQHVPIGFDDGDGQGPEVKRQECSPQSVNYKASAPVILYPFRLLDWSETVVAVGLSSNDSSFAPLDEYGRGAFGCTTIEYFNKASSSWVPL